MTEDERELLILTASTVGYLARAQSNSLSQADEVVLQKSPKIIGELIARIELLSRQTPE
ncbi:hypothetical protein NKW55_07765 [Gluconobacter kondonii]|uniref:hypothetical protein n=1 Tax=Gluconobacter kondonii TaxID=941463 RepID=UPI00209E3A46|nr:hypothetical protein [Gluconobacter kondonii]MCP1236504.1 hypothetical protein [Gluconobacter kondonii]